MNGRFPVRVAPLNVPFDRRRQTAAVFFWLVGFPLTVAFFFFICTVPFFWPLVIAYCLFLQLDYAPENGGRRFEFARKSPFWKWFADYFPIKLVKTADLDPSKNYVFGYHPHGIISVGAWINFATEANDFSKLLPGITIYLLTLLKNFKIPLYRDFLLAQGLASVSKESAEHIFGRGPGHSIVIVVGGTVESLSARPGIYDLTLLKRLGFVRLAITNGAPLVPVFSFGENDIWEQFSNDKGSKLWQVQDKVKQLSGWTIPLIHGRGLFNYDFGLLPHRRSIVTVIGKPIEVEYDPDPSQEKVLEVQKKYIDELYKIWDEYKDVYAKNRKSELTLIN